MLIGVELLFYREQNLLRRKTFMRKENKHCMIAIYVFLIASDHCSTNRLQGHQQKHIHDIIVMTSSYKYYKIRLLILFKYLGSKFILLVKVIRKKLLWFFVTFYINLGRSSIWRLCLFRQDRSREIFNFFAFKFFLDKFKCYRSFIEVFSWL